MSEAADPEKEGLRVVVLTGSDSQSGVVKDHKRRVPVMGNNDAWRLLSDELHWSRCHISPSYFRQGRRWNLANGSVILNLISDPDQNPKTLRVAERITAKVRDRLINDPRHLFTNRRDDTARTLQGAPWLHVPKVIRLRRPTLDRLRMRMEAEDFRFPAIVRATGTQTGEIVGLFQRPEDLADRFGGMTGEYYFTEFVDYRWSDGLYRKMRFYGIGDEVILRHRLISDRWNIHGVAREGIMKEREDLRAEERRFFEGDEVILERARETMKEVARRLKLDYFGLDCGPTEDGGFILFEANATMNITVASLDPRYAYTQPSLDRAAQALHRLLHQRAKPVGGA